MKIISVFLLLVASYYLYFFLTRNNIGSWFFFVILVNASMILLIVTQDKPKQYWFKAHRYGYGWSPKTWQGLIITLLSAILLGATVTISDTNAHSVSDSILTSLPLCALILSTLIAICVRTGEKASWRWGDKT